MKKIQLILLLIINAYVISAQDTTNVLFIGNSITYFNDMPQTFESIANDRGDTTAVTVYAPGGTGFINHVSDPHVYDKFRQGDWDFVVLQPGSNESPGYSETKEQTLMRLKILRDSILKYNPCAEVLLYEISYGVWGNTASDLNTYNGTMDLIRSNCEFWADSSQIFFAPAGEAMRTAWNNDLSTMLWGSTGNVHPNAKGSYLIACTLYATIFQKNSMGTIITNSLTQAEAELYQQLADTIVLNNLSDWRINTYDQWTDFVYAIDGQDVVFNSVSRNVDSLIWDLGDGTTTTLPEFSHTYAPNQLYTVTLTTYKGLCADSVSKVVDISTVGVSEFSHPDITVIYPNPFLNKLTLQRKSNTPIGAVKMYNLIGQDFTNLISIDGKDLLIEINTSRLPYGMYILKTKTFAKKVFKSPGND